MDTMKAFFAAFFLAVMVAILFTSKYTGGIISNMGGALSETAKGIEGGVGGAAGS